jgi:hypothetical protein
MRFFWWSLVMVGPLLNSDTSSLFQAFLWPWVPDSNLWPAVEELALLRFESTKKLENRILHEGAISFFSWSLVMVGLFLNSDTSSLFQAFLWPWVPESKLSPAIEKLALLRFDSTQKTRKSDIARGSYELFQAKPSRGRSVPQFRHIFTFASVSYALTSRIQNFSCHWKACSLALRFNLKNTKIGYRTRELWAFSGEA